MAGNNFDEFPEIPDLDNLEDDEQDEPIQRELLTIRLFKEAIREAKGNESDRILASFAENVLPNLILQLVGATAKGGQFTEDRKAESKNVERSKHDQSFISHLLNGLFATYRILKKLNSPEIDTNRVKRQCGDTEICLFIASYILHDFDKFPDYPTWLVANASVGKFQTRKWENDPPHKSDAPNFGRDYVKQKIEKFGLDKFLGEYWEKYIDDVVWLSHNAGEKYDSDRGMQSRGLQPCLDGRVRGVLQTLVRFSDLFASVIKHPRDVKSNGKNDGLPELLNDLSNGQLKFTYHALSDNRGVLTNILNNALIDTHPKQYYTPLLYLPDGVVYLATTNAPIITTDKISNQVISKIYQLCKGQIESRLVGISRDDMKRRIKLAPYIHLFFTPQEIISKLAPEAVFNLSQNLDNLSSTLVEKQKKGQAPTSIDFELLLFDGRVDRLGKFLALVSSLASDKDRNLSSQLLSHLKLSNIERDFEAFADSGGTIYRYFYIASRFYESRLGISPDEERTLLKDLGKSLSEHLASRLQPKLNDTWSDLRTYVSRVTALPTGAVIEPKPDSFLVELNRYNAAKITGRGRENVCAMSSSSYTVTEQMESATLFSPQVYSNRQILFNAQAAKRRICSIWSIEIMLRQILMSKTNTTGKEFEEQKYRYLYLYPTYFFTPETNKFLQKAYNSITQNRFDAELRKHFISKEQIANFEVINYQQVDDLLIKENSQPEDDHTFKISYPDDETLTFFFIGLPPGRDPTDTESWVMPAWLSFVLPLVMDVKVVASESPVPPFINGADFEQTTLLDGEHQAIHSLVKKDNYRLDSILPRKSGKFSPLNALTAAYCIHLEVNRKKDGNPDWGRLADLARDLETSPLYVFHYLNKWLRKQEKLDSVPIAKVRLYFEFYYYFEPKGDDVTKLRHLTELYRKFYRAKSRSAKANAVLKPIDEAADVILKGDKALASDNESLTELVAARLSTLMKNVRRRAAEGKPTLVFVDDKWKPALNYEEERQATYQFAKYFVEVIFDGSFKSDRARLAGTQLNLIRDTCDYLYRLADDEERQARQQDEPDEVSELEIEVAV